MPQHRISEQQRALAKRLRRDETALENRLWHEVRASRFEGWKFKRQVPIEQYVADFVCFEARLIVEVDGPLHERTGNRLHDGRRDAALRRQGFRTLRFKADMALGRVLEEIRQALRTPPLPTLR